MSEQNPDGDKVTQAIQALRQSDAHLLDPVSFHNLEALYRRASAYEGSVRRILDTKILQLAHAFAARAAHTRPPGTGVAVDKVKPVPNETLKDLVHHLSHNDEPDRLQTIGGVGPSAPTELKAVAYFRNTWSKLSVNQRIKAALDNAPQNAGPINSHAVALRSLELMRDISPDYLNRFMTHIDTLMLLDLAGKESKHPRTNSR
ncbi:MAG: hypothetical protein RL392_31 [Pseudomonadota bacterium]|jgi:hypothetical protein